MRLNEPTNRANTNIVNTLLGEDKKHGTKSSLEYRVKGGEVLTTAKDKKKKKDQKNQADQQQQQQQREADRKNSRQNGFPTRSRERTGIPPRRYGLSDLAKMDEQELMTALREDPEFAAAVQEYSAQLEQKEKEEKAAEEARKDRRSKPSSPPVAARRQARLKASSEPTGSPTTIRPGLEEYPDHIRELMDSGVPVTQWIVLLILVGAGLYYLMGPELKEGLAYIMKQTGKTNKRSQQKGSSKSKLKSKETQKGKKTVDPPRKSPTVKQSPVVSDSSSETSKRQSPDKPSTEQDVPKETISQPSTADKTKKKKNKNKNKKETKESLDLESTDDGSTHHSDTEETTPAAPTISSTPGISIPLIHMEPDDTNAGEWETVGKSRKPVAKAPPAVPVVAEEQKMPAVQKTKVEKAPASNSQIAVEATSQQSNDIQQQEIEAVNKFIAQEESVNDGWEPVSKSRKPKAPAPVASESSKPATSNNLAQQKGDEDQKKPETNVVGGKKAKKKKNNKTVQPAKPNKPGDVTEGDAELALKLQMEEEKLAKQGAGQTEEEWEEVKTNKSKKGQKVTSS